MMGIGGTGVVTVNQILGTAAMLDGRHVRGLDQTGLSQKGGPVVSDLRLASSPIEISNKVSAGGADLYLGFDLLVATDPLNLDKAEGGRTIAVVSTSQIPTGQMVADTSVHFPELASALMSLDRVTRKDANVYVDALGMAEALFNDHMATNFILVGAAYQAGALPISAGSVEAAIQLNGVSVDMNLLAFRWGRMAVVDARRVEAAVQTATGKVEARQALSAEAAALVEVAGAQGELRRLLEVRVPELIAYQDAAYAKRYADVVARVAAEEARKTPGRSGLSEAVARNLFKLMAYKPAPLRIARSRALGPLRPGDPLLLALAPAPLPRPRPHEEDPARLVVPPGVRRPPGHAGASRHRPRSLRLRARAPRGAGAGRRVPRPRGARSRDARARFP